MFGMEAVPSGYCQCGCGQQTAGRFAQGHGGRRPAWVEDTNGCWVWQRWINDQGYGEMTIDGRKRRAHRVVYEHLVGPIPEGLSLDHLCNNRACVNPAHLDPVSHAINLRRGRERRTCCRAGHEYTEANTRWTTIRRGDRTYRVRFCRACDARNARLRYQRRS